MEVNFVAVLVAGVASFVIGGLWYSGMLFGPMWVKLLGWDEKRAAEAKKGGSQSMAIGFLATLVTAYVLAYFVNMFGATDAQGGVRAAFWLWLGFVATTQLGGFLWEKKPFKLFVLNTAYSFLSLAVMGIILSLWK